MRQDGIPSLRDDILMLFVKRGPHAYPPTTGRSKSMPPGRRYTDDIIIPVKSILKWNIIESVLYITIRIRNTISAI